MSYIFISNLQHQTNLADTQFLWMDLGITTCIAIAMGRTQPASKLSPTTPSASLISISNFVSVFLQLGLAVGVQIGAMSMLESQSWFIPLNPPSPEVLITLCWETTTIFSVSAFQYLILALVLSKGAPFRSPFYKNRAFVAVWLFLTGVTLLLATTPPIWLASFFYLMPVDEINGETTTFRLTLLALPASNLIVAVVLEVNN